MSSLQEWTPSTLYCVYCHAEAFGPCATCHALICSDCARMSGGSVKKVAVCYRCHEQGHGQVRRGGWWSVLKPVVAILGLMAIIWLVLTLLLQ